VGSRGPGPEVVEARIHAIAHVLERLPEAQRVRAIAEARASAAAMPESSERYDFGSLKSHLNSRAKAEALLRLAAVTDGLDRRALVAAALESAALSWGESSSCWLAPLLAAAGEVERALATAQTGHGRWERIDSLRETAAALCGPARDAVLTSWFELVTADRSPGDDLPRLPAPFPPKMAARVLEMVRTVRDADERFASLLELARGNPAEALADTLAALDERSRPVRLYGLIVLWPALSGPHRAEAAAEIVPWIEGMLATGNLAELAEGNAPYPERFFWYPPLRCDGLLPAGVRRGLLRWALADADVIRDDGARAVAVAAFAARAPAAERPALFFAARAAADKSGRHRDDALLAIAASAEGSPAPLAGPRAVELPQHIETALRAMRGVEALSLLGAVLDEPPCLEHLATFAAEVGPLVTPVEVEAQLAALAIDSGMRIEVLAAFAAHAGAEARVRLLAAAVAEARELRAGAEEHLTALLRFAGSLAPADLELVLGWLLDALGRRERREMLWAEERWDLRTLAGPIAILGGEAAALAVAQEILALGEPGT
jgi:hypothetical protein